MLSIKNPHELDSKIKFQKEGHKYWINGDDRNVISTTTFIHKFFGEFNTEKIINNILKSEKYNDPTYKYHKMTYQDIKDMWDTNSKIASEQGTNLHEDIENYYNNINVKNDSVEFQQFLNFFNEHKKLEIYRTEWLVFNEELKISGSIDAVFENPDSTLSIGDWKRSKEIKYESFNKYGKYPLQHIADTNYYHYSLQLNLYRVILEKFYGKKIKDMFLVILHPDNENGIYKKINIKNMDKEIELLFEFRKKELDNITINSNNIVFSEKQKKAYHLLIKGDNVFLTGMSGSGKSLIIKSFYKEYKNLKKIGITSTTGVSALLIGGTTLHSYLGIGLGKDITESLYLKIKNNKFILKRWLDLECLIIDEISMLNPDLFDKLELLARKIRENELPFGGIQLILTGDCLQLPAVKSFKFCFEAKSWYNCIKKENIIYLKEIFRQNDIIFQKCLNEIRIGELSKETINILKERVNVDLVNDYGILPTKIYSLNKDVDKYNEKQLDKLVLNNEELEFFRYELTHTVLKKNLKFIEERIKKASNAPEILEICIGAQVMLIYNLDLDSGLVNGSRGIVTKFEDGVPMVKFLNGLEILIDYNTWIIEENSEKILSITQIPLKISYSCSIHKIQGVSLDYAEIDLKNIFEEGQAYVALSRVTKLSGLSIKNFKESKIFANKKAVEFYKNLE